MVVDSVYGIPTCKLVHGVGESKVRHRSSVNRISWTACLAACMVLCFTPIASAHSGMKSEQFRGVRQRSQRVGTGGSRHDDSSGDRNSHRREDERAMRKEVVEDEDEEEEEDEEECPIVGWKSVALGREIHQRSFEAQCGRSRSDAPCLWNKDVSNLYDDVLMMEGIEGRRAWSDILQAWTAGPVDYLSSIRDAVVYVSTLRDGDVMLHLKGDWESESRDLGNSKHQPKVLLERQHDEGRSNSKKNIGTSRKTGIWKGEGVGKSKRGNHVGGTWEQAIRIAGTVVRFAEAYPLFSTRYGADELLPGMVEYHLLKVLSARSICPLWRKKEVKERREKDENVPVEWGAGVCGSSHDIPMRDKDLEAWHSLYDKTGGEEWNYCSDLRDDPCACGFVQCQVDWRTKRRFVAVFVFATVGLRDKLPVEFAQFSSVRAVMIEHEPALRSVEDILPIFDLPALQALAVDFTISNPANTKLPVSRSLVGLSIGLDAVADTVDRVEEERQKAMAAGVSGDMVEQLGLYVQPEQLEGACQFPFLRRLSISGPATGLPECVGTHNQMLVELDIRGMAMEHHPTHEPLPASLRKLKRMRSFIAFQQSARDCPPIEFHQDQKKALSKCRLNYDSIIDGDDPLWICKGYAWRVRFDDRTQPWWSWPSLQRFWVDGNAFYGSIPSWIGSAWPAMHSIDLYTNELTGTIPLKSFLRMRQLVQIQLQDNNLSGTIPPNFFTPKNFPRLRVLNLQLNPKLKGCISTEEWRYIADAEQRPEGIIGLEAMVGKTGVRFEPTCTSTNTDKEE